MAADNRFSSLIVENLTLRNMAQLGGGSKLGGYWCCDGS